MFCQHRGNDVSRIRSVHNGTPSSGEIERRKPQLPPRHQTSASGARDDIMANSLSQGIMQQRRQRLGRPVLVGCRDIALAICLMLALSAMLTFFLLCFHQEYLPVLKSYYVSRYLMHSADLDRRPGRPAISTHRAPSFSFSERQAMSFRPYGKHKECNSWPSSLPGSRWVVSYASVGALGTVRFLSSSLPSKISTSVARA